jgi:hypothetical protein
MPILTWALCCPYYLTGWKRPILFEPRAHLRYLYNVQLTFVMRYRHLHMQWKSFFGVEGFLIIDIIWFIMDSEKQDNFQLHMMPNWIHLCCTSINMSECMIISINMSEWVIISINMSECMISINMSEWLLVLIWVSDY